MSHQQTKLQKYSLSAMASKDQKTLLGLLKFERSTPVTLDKGLLTERIEWRLPNGTIHREFGPAIIYTHKLSKQERWYFNGSVHREDGPAVITECFDVWCSPQNHSHKEYFIHGMSYFEAEFEALTSNKK